MPPRMARYGPTDRYAPAPGAGMCLSVFAVVRRRGKVLAGKPRLNAKWRDEWWASWGGYTADEQAEMLTHWKLPSTYLREGEHPEAALKRVMEQQLGAKRWAMKGMTVASYTAKSDWYPPHAHWDLAFVFEVTADVPERSSNWRELAWFSPKEGRAMEFGWNADLVRDLGLTKRP